MNDNDKRTSLLLILGCTGCIRDNGQRRTGGGRCIIEVGDKDGGYSKCPLREETDV